jgi:nucleotide-binding universal stress UspA family protein
MTKIVTCVDGSAMTIAVTNAAIWASNKLDKPILFLHTIEKEQQHGADNYSGAIGLGARSALLQELTELDEQRGKLALKLGKELLERVSKQAQDCVKQKVESMQRHGELADAIVDIEDKIRLIVIGRSGMEHGDNYSALGSNVETLLRKASHPVVLIPETFTQPTSFMVAYDGKQTADNALQRIIDGGLLHGLHCHLVSVKNNETNLEEKFIAAQQKLKEKGFDLTVSFVEGDVFDSLMDYKQKHKIGLIVMGAFGHSKLRQFFLGSNTLKMLERSKVPMVVLR